MKRSTMEIRCSNSFERKIRGGGITLVDKNEYIVYLLEQDEKILNSFQKFLSENRLSSHMLCLAQKNEEKKQV